MDNSNIFNQYFYEVLDDMEDLPETVTLIQKMQMIRKFLSFVKS